MPINLMIVEDDAEQRRLYENAVDRWNDTVDKNYVFDATIATTIEEGIEKVRTGDFDAAIVDLKFPGDVSGEASGNKIIHQIRKSLRCPIYVVSGNTADIDPEIEAHELININSRGINLVDDLFPLVLKRYQTGITKIMGRKGTFEEVLRKVFWNYMPTALPHWEQSDCDPDLKEKQLLRYTLAHVQQLLESNSTDPINPAEAYVSPPMHDEFFSGALIKRIEGEMNLSIVITPACTIENDQADFLQLVSLRNLPVHPKLADSKSPSNSRKAKIKAIVNNSNQRYHFLPAFQNIPNSYIDFQDVHSRSMETCRSDYEIICGISPAFLKDIANRFSAFYARQGSPDFDIETLSEKLNNEL